MRKYLSAAHFFCASNLTPVTVFGVLAAIMLLSSCGTAAPPPQRCDYEGPSGLCVHLDSNAMRFRPSALEAAYVQAKRDVETRYGLGVRDVAGPVVRVMSYNGFARLYPIRNRLDGDTGGHHGWTSFDSGEIVLTGPAVMRHEAFHYLLWKAGYPNELNMAHDHPVFDEYRDGEWLPLKQATTPLPTSASHRR